MEINKDQQVQKAGDQSIQNQLIGDNSSQTTIGSQINLHQTNIVTTNIPVDQVAALASTVTYQVMQQAKGFCIQIAEEKAIEKMQHFEKIWCPRVITMEHAVENLTDPKFHFMLRDANITAAQSSRQEDLCILSELLACHVDKGSNLKIDAGINRAIKIVNEIDLDALCALTVVMTIRSVVPTSGRIIDGLNALNNLYSKLLTLNLPENEEWLDHLDVLGLINIRFTANPKLENILSEKLDGYICIGMKKDSEEYMKTLEILRKNGISETQLVPNDLLEGYYRLNIAGLSSLKECLKSIIELYSNDKDLQKMVMKNFMNQWDSFESLRIVKEWFDKIPVKFIINSVGKVLAQTNAKRIFPEYPDLI